MGKFEIGKKYTLIRYIKDYETSVFAEIGTLVKLLATADDGFYLAELPNNRRLYIHPSALIYPAVYDDIREAVKKEIATKLVSL